MTQNVQKPIQENHRPTCIALLCRVIIVGLAGIFWTGGVTPGDISAQAQTYDETAPDNIPTTLSEDDLPSETEQGTEQESGTEGKFIRVEKLQDVDPDSLGLLSEEQGGLGAAMWQGTSRGQAQALMDKLPTSTPSPSVRNLSRQVLLSNAVAPQADLRADTQGESLVGESLVARRIELLRAMGDVEAVGRLMSLVPSRHELNSQAHRAWIDSMLLAGQYDAACRRAIDKNADYRELYWRKLRVLCNMVGQEEEKAHLSLALLREDGPRYDLFLDLAQAVLNDGNDMPSGVSDPTALYFALARLANATSSLSAPSATSDPALFSALATEASLPLAIRLAAAEQAEKFGLLPTQVLRGLYEAYASTPDPASNTASGESDPTAPAPTRAVMLQEAQRQGTDAGRAQALAALYTQAHEHGVGASVARVSAPLLRNLTPSYALSWFAPWAVRALLSVGDVDTALSWYDFIEENESAEDAANREEVWLWLQIADAENRLVWDGDVVSKWLARQDTRKDKAALILSLLEGLGKPVTGDHWAMVWETAEAQDGIPDTPLSPDLVNGLRQEDSDFLAHTEYLSPGLVNGLRQSVQSAATAQTVLLVLAILGDVPLDGVNPLALQEAVQALVGVGLGESARALALEAALGPGR